MGFLLGLSEQLIDLVNIKFFRIKFIPEPIQLIAPLACSFSLVIHPEYLNIPIVLHSLPAGRLAGHPNRPDILPLPEGL
jgi:hypothetical protein